MFTAYIFSLENNANNKKKVNSLPLIRMSGKNVEKLGRKNKKEMVDKLLANANDHEILLRTQRQRFEQ